MLDEVLAADQPVDHGVALRARVAMIVEKRPHVGGRRRQTGQIEIDAAEEFGVAAQARGQDLHPLPLGGDQLVDLAPGFRRLPDKTAAVAHHRERGRRVGTFVAGQHRGLAAAHGGEHALPVGGRHFGVAAFNERLAGHVAGGRVGIGCHDPHLLCVADCVDHGVFGENVDLRHAGGQKIQFGACGNPAAQRAVVGRVGLEHTPALVRHVGRRLEQHQAVAGRGRIDPPRGKVVGECAMIEDRIVAAERELEAVLALGRTVARAGVAARPREHRGRRRE